MGFLRKDWDYENPAEHDMELPAEERKEHRVLLWVLALLCWVLTVYAMYYTEKEIYGGAIDMNTMSYAIIPLGLGLGFLLQEEDEGKKQAASQRLQRWPVLKWIGRGVVVACLIFLLWVSFTDKQRFLIGVQYLCLLPFVFVLERMEKRETVHKPSLAAWAILWGFAILAVVSLGFPRLLGITTVDKAEQMLTEKGYTAVAYVECVRGEWLDIPFQTVPRLSGDAAETEMYLFAGKKEGERWGIAVDPWTGEIIAEEGTGENETLQLWLN